MFRKPLAAANRARSADSLRRRPSQTRRTRRASIALASVFAASLGPIWQGCGEATEYAAVPTAIPQPASPAMMTPAAAAGAGAMATPAAAPPAAPPAAPASAMSTTTPAAPAVAVAAEHDPATMHQNDGLDHCRTGHAPDPRDATLSGEPERFQAGANQFDLIMPKEIRDWMTERGMQRSHDDWHLIRQLDGRCFQSNATPESCAFARELADRGLKRYRHQECSRLEPGDTGPGDGKQFMWEHRHMIDSMNQAFPQHKQLFTGFEKVPRSTSDPNNPMPWKAVNWSPSQNAAIDVLENIEQNADMFEDEEYLAWYIQCRVLWTPQNPNGPSDNVNSGFHLAMHGQWAVFGSPSSVGEQRVSIENFVFWKLHGWIDQIWHRYRTAKGLTDEEPEYKQGLFDMCKEMHEITLLREGQSASTAEDAGDAPMPVGPETGYFAEQVRPFLNERCSTCHGGASPMAGLILGGLTGASSDIIAKLVNVDSSNKQFKLIVPGDPDQSWVYLKASGDAANVQCTSCVKDAMPPAGEKLTGDQLMRLRQWITDGAPAQ
jgi:hypothetical protein